MVVRASERREQMAEQRGEKARTQTGGTMVEPPTSRTVGFEPSCDCNAEPAPATVLDPFNGAGTTGLVAVRNGRSYIGLELNDEYAQMARERIATDIRLGHRPPTREKPRSEAQGTLLDALGTDDAGQIPGQVDITAALDGG